MLQWFLLLAAMVYSQAVPTPLNSNNLNSNLPVDQLANSTTAPLNGQPPPRNRFPPPRNGPPALNEQNAPHGNILVNGKVVGVGPQIPAIDNSSISQFTQHPNSTLSPSNVTVPANNTNVKTNGVGSIHLLAFKLQILIWVSF